MTDAEIAELCRTHRGDPFFDSVSRMAVERDELRSWKAQAMAVESEWDCQAVAKMLSVQPGQSCRKGIAEKVPAVLKELAELMAICEKAIDFYWNNGESAAQDAGEAFRMIEAVLSPSKSSP